MINKEASIFGVVSTGLNYSSNPFGHRSTVDLRSKGPLSIGCHVENRDVYHSAQIKRTVVNHRLI